MDDPANDSPGRDGGDGERPDTRSLAETLERLRRDVTRLGNEARTFAAIQVDRARLIARDALWAARTKFVLVLVLVVTLIVTVTMFLGGAAWAVSSLSGIVWLGPLVVGAAGLGAIAAGFALDKRMVVARTLAELERKYGGASAANGSDVGSEPAEQSAPASEKPRVDLG